LIFKYTYDRRYLHSFPTRRSSGLLGLHGEVLWRLQIRVKPARVEDARRIELGLEIPVQLHQGRRRGWKGGGALVPNPPEQGGAATQLRRGGSDPSRGQIRLEPALAAAPFENCLPQIEGRGIGGQGQAPQGGVPGEERQLLVPQPAPEIPGDILLDSLAPQLAAGSVQGGGSPGQTHPQ